MENIKVANSTTSVDVHELFKLITRSLVGSIPIVGAPLSIASGFLFDWLDGKPDPWVEFENKINRLITNKLKESESRHIRNSLSGLDSNLNRFLIDYERSVNSDGHKNNIPEFNDRIGNISDDVERLLPHILNPTSHFATIPYLEHFVVLSVAVNIIGEKFAIGTRDFTRRRRDLYKSIEEGLGNSLRLAANERAIEIELKNFNTSSNKRIGDAVYDYSKDIKLGGTLFFWPSNVVNAKLTMIKSCARLISTVDLFNIAVTNIILIAKEDKTTGFDVEPMKRIYQNYVVNSARVFKNDWNSNVLRNMRNHEDMHESFRVLSRVDESEFSKLPAILPPSIISKDRPTRRDIN